MISLETCIVCRFDSATSGEAAHAHEQDARKRCRRVRHHVDTFPRPLCHRWVQTVYLYHSRHYGRPSTRWVQTRSDARPIL